MSKAGRQIKRVSLELGGNGPFVIFADADLDNPKNAAPIETPVEKLASEKIAKQQDDIFTTGEFPTREEVLSALKGKAKEPIFEKPVHASEKAHYEAIVKSNKETIASLRKQVADLQEELEATKVSK
jgi:hypothetical protein